MGERERERESTYLCVVRERVVSEWRNRDRYLRL